MKEIELLPMATRGPGSGQGTRFKTPQGSIAVGGGELVLEIDSIGGGGQIDTDLLESWDDEHFAPTAGHFMVTAVGTGAEIAVRRGKVAPFIKGGWAVLGAACKFRLVFKPTRQNQIDG